MSLVTTLLKVRANELELREEEERFWILSASQNLQTQGRCVKGTFGASLRVGCKEMLKAEALSRNQECQK